MCEMMHSAQQASVPNAFPAGRISKMECYKHSKLKNRYNHPVFDLKEVKTPKPKLGRKE